MNWRPGAGQMPDAGGRMLVAGTTAREDLTHRYDCGTRHGLKIVGNKNSILLRG